MTVSEVLEDSAPMIAVTQLASSLVTDCVAMLVDVSPESFWMMESLMPFFAALMSATARLVASIAGGPRTARDPVCGRIVPSLRFSVLVGAAAGVLEQPLRTMAATPRSATPPIRVALNDRELRRLVGDSIMVLLLGK